MNAARTLELRTTLTWIVTIRDTSIRENAPIVSISTTASAVFHGGRVASAETGVSTMQRARTVFVLVMSIGVTAATVPSAEAPLSSAVRPGPVFFAQTPANRRQGGMPARAVLVHVRRKVRANRRRLRGRIGRGLAGS